MREKRNLKRWSVLGLLVLPTTGAMQAADTSPPPCTATATFDQTRVTVGQQVSYRVRITHGNDVTSVDWSETPSFPGFRAEWLPDAVAPQPIDTAGTFQHMREERRALFPARAGTLRVEPPDLLCRLAGGKTALVAVPAAVLQATAPPSANAGQPGGDLIGPVTLQALVTPNDVVLGETVRVAIMLRGHGNLWMADDPLAAIDGADVFRRRPELTREAGERLVYKRHFAYDVVPLRTGTLVIPPVRVPYFDATSGRFEAAQSEPLRVVVKPRSRELGGLGPGMDPGDARAEASAEAGDPAKAQPTPARSWGPRVSLTAVALGVSLSATLWIRRHLRRSRALAAFDAALRGRPSGVDEATVLADALRQALARRLPGTRTQSAEEIVALPALAPAEAEAARLLEATNRSRFDPKAPRSAPERVREAIAKL